MLDERHEHGAGAHLDTPHGRVYYELEGNGPPVVLVPGGPGAAHAHYHPWFSALAGQHTVVYLDQLGTGRSDRPPAQDLTVGLYADTVALLLAHLGAPRAALVGLSFGGIPAAELAARQPDLVSGLVLVDAQVDAQGWQDSNIDNVAAQLRTQWPEVWRQVEALRAAGVRSDDDRWGELLGGPVDVLEWAHPDHVALRREPESRFDTGTYTAFLGDDPEQVVGGALAGHTVLDRLAAAAVPTLVVTGRHDRVTTPAVADRIARALGLPDDQPVVFERSAHRPWAEEPEAFVDVVRPWLAACPS